MNIKIENVEKTLEKSLEDACGLTTYRKTLELDSIMDKDYRKMFTSYYRIRRDSEWLESFYSYMYEIKDREDITFEEILCKLSSWEHSVKVSGKNPNGCARTIEVSFSSKLLATISPDNPIWDSQVVKALNIKIKEKGEWGERIKAYAHAYGELKKAVQEYINSDDGKKAIELFDNKFPNYADVSDYKKIDFYLWNLGKNK